MRTIILSRQNGGRSYETALFYRYLRHVARAFLTLISFITLDGIPLLGYICKRRLGP
jgi:hypothetical protein